MIEDQTMLDVGCGDLLSKVKERFDGGWRLVQIGASKLSGCIEVNYSFDRNYEFANLRLTIASTDEELPSISGIYWSAFLYENELHDLFGLKIKGIVVDYKGNFYKTTLKWPFNQSDNVQTKEK